MAGFGDQTFGDSPFGTGGDGTRPLTATPQPTSTPPRVRLDIVTTAATVTVTRVAQDGSRFLVRTNDDNPLEVIGGAATLYDPEAPYGEPVYYVTDGGSVSETVILDVPDVWLVHPNVPSRSVKVSVVSVSDRVMAANQSMRWPLGRKFPISANDGQRKSATFTLVLGTEDAAELAALELIVDDLSPLLLNVPPSLRWIDPRTEYVAIGDVTPANPAAKGWVSDREWSLPCTVVDRPSGGSQSFNTYGFSFSLYPLYADRKAAAATYADAYNITV